MKRLCNSHVQKFSLLAVHGALVSIHVLDFFTAWRAYRELTLIFFDEKIIHSFFVSPNCRYIISFSFVCIKAC